MNSNLLASGNNGFDLDLAYEIAKNSIESFEGTNLKKVILVIYGDTIATFLKGKGVSVINMQVAPKVDKKKEAQKQQAKQLAAKVMEEQIGRAIEYLKDEKNREKVIAAGIGIAKFAIEVAAKKKLPKK